MRKKSSQSALSYGGFGLLTKLGVLGMIPLIGWHLTLAAQKESMSPTPKEEVKTMLAKVKWFGHATVKLSGSKIIYFDPYQITQNDQADIILITHEHYDHLSPKDLEKVQTRQTIIVVPSGTKNLPRGQIRTIKPGERIIIEGIEIQAVPAYNINKAYHPKAAGYVGYVVKLDGITYYHAGDTDLIPEMKNIHPDVAFLPVGGTYTMTAAEAARATADIRPKVAVPIHWGAIVGSRQDAENFKKLATCEVQILTKAE